MTYQAPPMSAAERRAAIEEDNAYEIERLRAELLEHLSAAVTQVQLATNKIGQLTSPHVYDVELAEGGAGRDVTGLLDDAGRLVRAAQAVALHTIPQS